MFLSLCSLEVLTTVDFAPKMSEYSADFPVKQLRIVGVLEYPFPFLVCSFARSKIVVLSLGMTLLCELIRPFSSVSVHTKADGLHFLVGGNRRPCTRPSRTSWSSTGSRTWGS